MKRYRHDQNAPSHLRRLLESAKGDDLAPDRHRRVAERLGILPGLVVPPGANVEGPASSFSWTAVTGIALAAMALVGASATILRPPPSPVPSAATVAAADRVTPLQPPAAIAAIATPSEGVSVNALPDVSAIADGRAKLGPPIVVAPKRESSPAASSRIVGATTEASDLKLELALLDEVRRATESHRSALALTLLDTYASKFPAGTLREEATVLRIEALHASGDQTKADALARELFRKSPNTPYAARIRAASISTSRE